MQRYDKSKMNLQNITADNKKTGISVFPDSLLINKFSFSMRFKSLNYKFKTEYYVFPLPYRLLLQIFHAIRHHDPDRTDHDYTIYP